MRERPIIFSAPMVRAILASKKRQTRRIVKAKQLAVLHRVAHLPAEELHQAFINGKMIVSGATSSGRVSVELRSPYGCPGDFLWVKETWREEHGPCQSGDQDDEVRDRNAISRVIYRADAYPPWPASEETSKEDVQGPTTAVRWRSSLFMPRSASRILLEVTAVRIERLQSISVADAIAEGMPCHEDVPGPMNGTGFPSGQAAEPLPGPVACYRKLFQTLNGAGTWEANPLVWVVDFTVVDPKRIFR